MSTRIATIHDLDPVAAPAPAAAAPAPVAQAPASKGARVATVADLDPPSKEVPQESGSWLDAIKDHASKASLSDIPNALLGAVHGVTQGLGADVSAAGNTALDAGKAVYNHLGGDKTPYDPKAAYQFWKNRYNSGIQAAKQESPWSFESGQLVGGAATPMGKMSAAKAALMGATNAYGQAQLDGKDATQQASVGAALGAASHGLLSGAGEGLGYLKNKLSDWAEANAEKAVNPTMRKMIEIMRRNKGDGDSVGRTLLDTGTVGFGDTTHSINEKLADETSDVGQKIGKAYAAADEATVNNPAARVTVQDVRNQLKPSLDRYRQTSPGSKVADAIEAELDAMEEKHGTTPLSFDTASKEVTDQQKLAFQGAPLDPSLAQNLRQRMSMAARDALTQKMEAALPDAGMKGLNRTYANLALAQGAAERAAAGVKSNRAIGQTDYLAGIIGGTVTGSKEGALVAMGINKALKGFYRSSMAAGENRLAQGAGLLSRQLEAGAPVGDIIRKAAALGIPLATLGIDNSPENSPAQ